MKKISILLGLVATASEADILEAIKAIQDKLKTFDDANIEITKELERLNGVNETLESENKILAEEKQIALNAIIDAEVEIKKLKEGTPGEDVSTEDIEALEKDVIELGKSILKQKELEVVYMTTDSTAFFTKEGAEAYAYKNQLKVITVDGLIKE